MGELVHSNKVLHQDNSEASVLRQAAASFRYYKKQVELQCGIFGQDENLAVSVACCCDIGMMAVAAKQTTQTAQLLRLLREYKLHTKGPIKHPMLQVSNG